MNNVDWSGLRVRESLTLSDIANLIVAQSCVPKNKNEQVHRFFFDFVMMRL